MGQSCSSCDDVDVVQLKHKASATDEIGALGDHQERMRLNASSPLTVSATASDNQCLDISLASVTSQQRDELSTEETFANGTFTKANDAAVVDAFHCVPAPEEEEEIVSCSMAVGCASSETSSCGFHPIAPASSFDMYHRAPLCTLLFDGSSGSEQSIPHRESSAKESQDHLLYLVSPLSASRRGKDSASVRFSAVVTLMKDSDDDDDTHGSDSVPRCGCDVETPLFPASQQGSSQHHSAQNETALRISHRSQLAIMRRHKLSSCQHQQQQPQQKTVVSGASLSLHDEGEVHLDDDM